MFSFLSRDLGASDRQLGQHYWGCFTLKQENVWGNRLELEKSCKQRNLLNTQMHKRVEKLFFPPIVLSRSHSPFSSHRLLHANIFCKFSFLTLCQVKGRGHASVNCSACQEFPVGPSPSLQSPVHAASMKRNHHLPVSHSAKRRLGEKRAGRGKERRVVSAHLKSSQSHTDYCYYCRF